MSALLHVTDDLAPGGAATQLRMLSGALAALGLSSAVASLRFPHPAWTDAGWGASAPPTRWLGARWPADPLAVRRLGAAVRDAAPACVVSWDRRSAAVVARGFGRRRRSVWLHIHRDPRSLPWAARKADIVIAPCAELADQAAQAGIERGRRRVVPNACMASEPADPRRRSAVRAALGARGDAPLVLASQRLDDGFWQKELPWAADLLRVVRPGVRLVVVGDGPDRRACQRFADAATERGTVVYAGHRADWPRLLAAADVVWVGSRSPGAPTPLVEAMAAGRPVVASDAPGRAALVEDGVSAWRTGYGDRAGWVRATERVLADPATAHAVASEGRNRALAECGIDGVAAMWAALLSEAGAGSVAAGGASRVREA